MIMQTSQYASVSALTMQRKRKCKFLNFNLLGANSQLTILPEMFIWQDPITVTEWNPDKDREWIDNHERKRAGDKEKKMLHVNDPF